MAFLSGGLHHRIKISAGLRHQAAERRDSRFPHSIQPAAKRWINYWKIIDGVESERADPHTWEKLDGSTSYQAICAVCHTSQLRNLTGGGFAPNDLEFKEPGIGCEMCHGPSAQHAVEMAQNQFYPKAPLDPPVNFREAGNRELCRDLRAMPRAVGDPKARPCGRVELFQAREIFSAIM